MEPEIALLATFPGVPYTVGLIALLVAEAELTHPVFEVITTVYAAVGVSDASVYVEEVAPEIFTPAFFH